MQRFPFLKLQTCGVIAFLPVLLFVSARGYKLRLGVLRTAAALLLLKDLVEG